MNVPNIVPIPPVTGVPPTITEAIDFRRYISPKAGQNVALSRVNKIPANAAITPCSM